ncbi:hypothetical protein V493_04074 [Pseudogymnoascus sp. VKM F-4281 (FW-2241)]|nr:hypothetical protein V493_04074 [Pseudogymnoascus sp. VKM F-4281 (FW-2241)]
MATMRAIDIKNGTGPASALFLNSSIPKPSPKPTEALVRVKAFGLNRMDLLQREGKYPLPPNISLILGVEFSGVVEELGAEAQKGKFKVGDEVFGLAYGGAYAEFLTVSPATLLHKPSTLTWETAAAIPETFMTATQALHLIGAFKRGDSVLWHAGASSVSIAGIQLSKLAGASAVYVTSRTPDKIKWCVDTFGAAGGFDSTKENWGEEAQKATGGKGIDVIVDFMGASTFSNNLKAAAKDGRIANLGLMGGVNLPAGTNIGVFLAKRLRYEGSSLRSRDEKYQAELTGRLEGYLEAFAKGDLEVKVEKVFDWKDVVKAHELLESNGTKVKVGPCPTALLFHNVATSEHIRRGIARVESKPVLAAGTVRPHGYVLRVWIEVGCGVEADEPNVLARLPLERVAARVLGPMRVDVVAILTDKADCPSGGGDDDGGEDGEEFHCFGSVRLRRAMVAYNILFLRENLRQLNTASRSNVSIDNNMKSYPADHRYNIHPSI